MANPTGPTDKQLKLLSELITLSKTYNILESQRLDIERDILNNTIKTTDNLARAAESADRAYATEVRRLRVAEKKKQLETDILDIAKDYQDNIKNILKLDKGNIEAQIDKIKAAQEALKLSGLQDAAQEATLDKLKEQYDQLNKIANNPSLVKVFANGAAAAEDVQKKVNGIFSKIPGGDILQKALGLDNIGEQLQQGLSAGLAEGNLKDGFKAFTGSVNMAGLALAGVVLAIKGLWDLMSKLNEEASAYAEATGLSVGQAGALVQKSYELQASFANELASREDILAVQKDIAKEFKGIVQLSDATVLSLANMSANLDYASETAGQVQAALMSLGGTESASLEAQQLAANLADAAGVAPGPVMEDIAANAKLASKYFGNNVKALARAAAEGAKLGLSLDQMVKLSDSLLDIESSLSNQFEYMALTGKEVNFDLARQLAYQGDIAGAAESIINEMGGLPDDPLALQAAAAAAGLSVEELQKVYATSANINGLTDHDKADRKEAAAEAAKMAEQQKEMAVQLEKIASIFTSILLPVVKVFGYILSGVSALVEGMLLPITTAVKGFQDIYNLIVEGKGELKFWETTLASFAGILLGIKATQLVITASKAMSAMFTKQETTERKKGLVVMIKEAAVAAGKAIAQITGMSAATLGAAAATALAAGAAAAAYFSSVVPTGDMFSPADGRTQISTKEGGLFQLSKNDDVIAAPGLASAMSAISPSTSRKTASTGGSMDTSRLESLMETLITKIDEVSNRTANIIINDRVVDEIKMSADIISTYKVGRK